MRVSPCKDCKRGCPQDGCKERETWFIQNWNKNIHRLKRPQKKTRQFWQYEHPDLEGKHDPGKLI